MRDMTPHCCHDADICRCFVQTPESSFFSVRIRTTVPMLETLLYRRKRGQSRLVRVRLNKPRSVRSWYASEQMTFGKGRHADGYAVHQIRSLSLLYSKVCVHDSFIRHSYSLSASVRLSLRFRKEKRKRKEEIYSITGLNSLSIKPTPIKKKEVNKQDPLYSK